MSEELEQYYLKGGTYVIPVEIMNYWIGEYEELQSAVDKAIRFINKNKGYVSIECMEQGLLEDDLNKVIEILRSKN